MECRYKVKEKAVYLHIENTNKEQRYAKIYLIHNFFIG